MSEGSWLERMRAGFRKTSDRLGDNLSGLFTKASLDAQTLDEIEEALIASDLGPATAAKVRERLAGEKFEKGLTETAVRAVVAEELEKILRPVAEPLEIDAFPRPQVILVVGVNGSGKTTTIAKLAHLFEEQDYSVLLAAGDTFRAAAIEQLKIWADRAGVPIIAGPEGSDSSAIVYDGVKKATAEGIDVLIVDTAGRLHAKDRATGEAVYGMVDWYKEYASKFGTVLNENPSPGNVAGGLLNITIKSLGAIAKAGTTRVEGVVGYAEVPRAPGLWLMQGPGYDQESTPGLVASGAQIVVFTTGRGTTIGNAIAPVVKLASNSGVHARMSRDLDLSAGGIIDGTETIEQVGVRVLEHVRRVASGEVQARAEETKHREFGIWAEQSVSL